VRVENPGVELFRETQQRIVSPPAMAHVPLSHRARSPLTEEANPGGQVCAHPLVAACNNEVSELHAVIQRHMAERLCGIKETVSKLALLTNRFDNFANRQADTQVIDGWQKEAVAPLLDKSFGKILGNIVDGPSPTQNAVS